MYESQNIINLNETYRWKTTFIEGRWCWQKIEKNWFNALVWFLHHWTVM